jgi:hypothetical protein
MPKILNKNNVVKEKKKKQKKTTKREEKQKRKRRNNKIKKTTLIKITTTTSSIPKKKKKEVEKESSSESDYEFYESESDLKTTITKEEPIKYKEKDEEDEEEEEGDYSFFDNHEEEEEIYHTAEEYPENEIEFDIVDEIIDFDDEEEEEEEIPVDEYELPPYLVKEKKKLFKNSNIDLDKKQDVVSKDVSRICTICRVNEPNIVVVPCGHVIMCNGCTIEFKKNKVTKPVCTICKGGIDTMYKIFFS